MTEDKSEKYDLHTHLFTTWEQGLLSLERAPRNPDYILDAIDAAGMDGIVLANFADNRYEKLENQAKNWRGQYALKDNLRNALVFADKQGKEIKIIRGEEIPANEGHILVIGSLTGNNIKGGSLADVCKTAYSHGATVIASHPLDYGGIGKKLLIEQCSFFDSWEKVNCNFKPHSKMELYSIAKEMVKRGIAVSDTHNRENLGNAYVNANKGTISFLTASELKDSLKHAVITGKLKPELVQLNTLSSRLAHIGLCIYDTVRQKAELL